MAGFEKRSELDIFPLERDPVVHLPDGAYYLIHRRPIRSRDDRCIHTWRAKKLIIDPSSGAQKLSRDTVKINIFGVYKEWGEMCREWRDEDFFFAIQRPLSSRGAYKECFKVVTPPFFTNHRYGALLIGKKFLVPYTAQKGVLNLGKESARLTQSGVRLSDDELKEIGRSRYHREEVSVWTNEFADVTSPYLPKYLWSSSRPRFYLLLEYIDGLNLEKALKSPRKMNLEQRICIVKDVAEAVCVFSRKNMVHQDIKPANVIVRKSGEAVLTDFGNAQLVPKDGFCRSTKLASRWHRAPEQLAEIPNVGKPSDVSQLAQLAYMIITGRFPYFPEMPAKDFFQAIRNDKQRIFEKTVHNNVLRGLFTAPENVIDMPKDIAEVITASLSVSPDNRPTAREFIKVLKGDEPEYDKQEPSLLESRMNKQINLITSRYKDNPGSALEKCADLAQRVEDQSERMTLTGRMRILSSLGELKEEIKEEDERQQAIDLYGHVYSFSNYKGRKRLKKELRLIACRHVEVVDDWETCPDRNKKNLADNIIESLEALVAKAVEAGYHTEVGEILEKETERFFDTLPENHEKKFVLKVEKRADIFIFNEKHYANGGILLQKMLSCMHGREQFCGNKSKIKARVFKKLGDLAVGTGDYDYALRRCNEALSAVSGLTPNEQSRIKIQIERKKAYVLALKGDIDSATDLVEAIQHPNRNRVEIGWTLYFAGMIRMQSRDKHDHRKAFDYFREAREQFAMKSRKRGDARLNWTDYQMAKAAISLGRTTPSIETALNRTVNLMIEGKGNYCPDSLFLVKYNLGRYYMNNRKHENALAQISEGLRVYGDSKCMARMGFREAAEFLFGSLDILLRLRDHYDQKKLAVSPDHRISECLDYLDEFKKASEDRFSTFENQVKLIDHGTDDASDNRKMLLKNPQYANPGEMLAKAMILMKKKVS